MARKPHSLFTGSITKGRREFLRHGLVGMGVLVTGALVSSCRESTPPATGGMISDLKRKLGRRLCSLGPLREADENGVALPDGFTSRIVARSGQEPVAGCGYRWHAAPDGAAVYAVEDGGWIYVSNCELGGERGGVGALRFDAGARVVNAYPILENTTLNCSGGSTPWGSWLSCEEFDLGRVWECDPRGKEPAVVWPALGVFKHEAVVIDPARQQLYLTEDRGDGLFYRFTPDRMSGEGHADLSSGTLEAAEVTGGEQGPVRWHRVADPRAARQPTRVQVPKATIFKGGEGAWFHDGVVFFTTKLDNRVWALDTAQDFMAIVYDVAALEGSELEGVDNVMVSAQGDVVVAEDGGNNQLMALAPDGNPAPVLQVIGHDGSEIAGPAFDPSGTRLYFSSQRGSSGESEDGVTFEITGPFAG